MEWNAVAEQIVLDDQNKWHRKVSGQALRLSDAGKLEVLENSNRTGARPLSDLAEVAFPADQGNFLI